METNEMQSLIDAGFTCVIQEFFNGEAAFVVASFEDVKDAVNWSDARCSEGRFTTLRLKNKEHDFHMSTAKDVSL